MFLQISHNPNQQQPLTKRVWGRLTLFVVGTLSIFFITAASTQAGSDHWAYQALSQSKVPSSDSSSWSKTAIDRLVAARWQEHQLKPVADADKRTLLRRATYDLTGFPPTLTETSDFLADSSPTAFAKVVDRLLASPAYGERWGRHWLDVVRYADTAGCASDYPVPSAYRYRNYIIDAFNNDKPYDQLIREQIAGDLLPAKDEADRIENIVATGYLAESLRFGVGGKEENLTIEDTIDNLGKTFLALTISCARCHDHKHDEITAADYYALYGFFKSTVYAFPGSENSRGVTSDFTPIGSADEVNAFKKIQAQIDAMEIERAVLKRKDRKLAAQVAGGDPKIIAEQKSLQKQQRELSKKIKILLKQNSTANIAYAVFDGKASDARIQEKGERFNKKAAVKRRFLEVLGGQQLPKEVAAKSSGRDHLAQWIADPANPLTARVMVNRIWQHHFGQGIVSTPNDFGKYGEHPTHPELLDYLARQFIQSGWSIKSLHRDIMLSRVYQLAGSDDAAVLAADPESTWLTHSRRRRLSSEEIVDSMLLLSNTLDPSQGQAHPFPPRSKKTYSQHHPFVDAYDSNRRAVYWMRQRLRKHPTLAIFDAADTKQSTGERALSTTAIQSLFMMNAPFVHDKSSALGARLINEGKDDSQRIALTHQLLFNRPATNSDVELGLRYLQNNRKSLASTEVAKNKIPQEALASYVRALMGSNEFLYLE
ncbi:MAG: DUF1549 and DUF1553 domain-containing protein [Verrucomicrobiota bacterium]